MLKSLTTQRLVGIQSMSFAISLFSRSHLGKKSKVVLTVHHGVQCPGTSLQWPQKAVYCFPIPRPSSPAQQQYLFGSNVKNRCVCFNETSTIKSRLQAGSCDSIYFSATFHSLFMVRSVSIHLSFPWTKENEQTLVLTKSLSSWVLLETNLNKELLPQQQTGGVTLLTFYFESLYHTCEY